MNIRKKIKKENLPKKLVFLEKKLEARLKLLKEQLHDTVDVLWCVADLWL